MTSRIRRKRRGGKERHDSSFQDFRDFVVDMEMGDIKFTGNTYTWTNNKKGVGFIQERLDRFYGSLMRA